MEWDVEFTDVFEDWWNGLDETEQEDVPACVGLLEQKGSSLPHPYSSGIKGSRHDHMQELRIQHAGKPYRVLYAFDPRRVALLLLGGDKTGNARWYEVFVPIADRLYDEHLVSLGIRSKTMAKPFKLLKDRMSPESRERAAAKAKRLMADMPLNELRAARRLTQEQLAAKLHVKQASVSKLERRADMYISTLRGYVEAMGGELEIVARFPDGDVRIDQFTEDAKIS